MAELVLRYDELQDGRLPALCMRCGAPSDVVVRRSFPVVGPLAPSLLGILLPLVWQKRVEVPVPLCRHHTRIWRRRAALVLLAVFAPVVSMAGLFLAARTTGQLRESLTAVLGPTFAVSLIYDVVILLVWRSLAIRVTHVDRDGVALAGVAKSFVEAVEEQDALVYGHAEDGALVLESPGDASVSEPEPELRPWNRAEQWNTLFPELAGIPLEEAKAMLVRCLRSQRIRDRRERWKMVLTIGAVLVMAGPFWAPRLGLALPFVAFAAFFILYIIVGMNLQFRGERRLLRHLLAEELDKKDKGNGSGAVD
jgi:hypothetical protein